MGSFPTQVIGGRSDRPEFKTPLRVRLHPALELPGRKRIIVGPEIEAVMISMIGVNDYPVRAGSMLYTLVDPNRGHEVAYNRWYERDHFYAGCMVGPYFFAGRRYVATRPLKDLRFPATTPVICVRLCPPYVTVEIPMSVPFSYPTAKTNNRSLPAPAVWVSPVVHVPTRATWASDGGASDIQSKGYSPNRSLGPLSRADISGSLGTMVPSYEQSIRNH